MPIAWNNSGVKSVAFHSLSLAKWAMTSEQCLTAGAFVHDAMENAKKEAVSHLGDHSDEAEPHLRMAGAAVLMIQSGQPMKAQRVYNDWASWTGYPAITVMREHPTLIDLDGMIIEAHGNEMELLSCR